MASCVVYCVETCAKRCKVDVHCHGLQCYSALAILSHVTASAQLSMCLHVDQLVPHSLLLIPDAVITS